MKNALLILFVLAANSILAQEAKFQGLTGEYPGQKEPGLFAEDLVSIKEGIHGNIVFIPDFSEAAWRPNYKVYGRSVIYIVKHRNYRGDQTSI
jgi:hypothetical protein